MAAGDKFFRYSTGSGSTRNIKSSKLFAEEHTSLNECARQDYRSPF